MEEKKPVYTETIKGKHGRFEYTVTKEYYDGEEERKLQIKALKFIKSIPPKNK